MFLEVSLLVLTAGTTFYLKKSYENRKKLPTLTNVRRELSRLLNQQSLASNLSESEVEQCVAQGLNKFFKQVNTQYPVGGSPQARERVDIDIGNGQLGIEIKLAKLLKKSNERNRLLGQIELYRERKYKNGNLLVLIVGEAQYEQEANILELKKILANKAVDFLYFKTT